MKKKPKSKSKAKVLDTFVIDPLDHSRPFGIYFENKKLKARVKFPNSLMYPTLCIQFLDREKNDKNNTFPLRKQICFTIVWGCAEILPKN